jgi:hypothetical protein
MQVFALQNQILVKQFKEIKIIQPCNNKKSSGSFDLAIKILEGLEKWLNVFIEKFPLLLL